MHTKSLSRVQIKDAEQGIVSLSFSTFNELDKDGDVTRKGAFTDGAPVVVSSYGHKSWDGELPIGKGKIVVKENEATADVRFFLQTTHGRDAFETIKELSDDDLQEWSYSLEEVEAERGTFQGKNVRFINKVTVKEVSPVLRGAGNSTRTLAVKQHKQLMSQVARMLSEAGSARWNSDYGYTYLDDFDIDANTAVFCICDYRDGERLRYRIQVEFTRTDTSVELGDIETEVEYTTVYLPKGSKFSEHQDIALRGVKSLVEMAVERLTLRTAEGKSTTEQNDAYDQLIGAISPLKSAIDATQTNPTGDLAREFARFVALTNGVPTS